MPSYDYRCEADQQVYEVQHSMSERLNTWQELCERTGISLGDIPADTKLTKLISGGAVVQSHVLKNPEAPPCFSSGSCSGGNCGM
ncbi:hypothetical protein SAMN02745866_01356 [Alteromonadaceae bacterium Bs31]|nr:hypothetical protein SAMN02745866_01356 [Alteromonadaceae bacterium Bs31]